MQETYIRGLTVIQLLAASDDWTCHDSAYVVLCATFVMIILWDSHFELEQTEN